MCRNGQHRSGVVGTSCLFFIELSVGVVNGSTGKNLRNVGGVTCIVAYLSCCKYTIELYVMGVVGLRYLARQTKLT